MATRKRPPKSTARSGGTESAKTSARKTVSGPARSGRGDPADPPARKAMGVAALAEAMPANPHQGGRVRRSARKRHRRAFRWSRRMWPSPAARCRRAIHRRSRAPALHRAGFNATIGPLDRVRADAGGRALTTNQGVPVADNQNSLKAGLRGPALLEDFILREKITHFDHERIPERIVHARGSGAHGYFECYEPLTKLTRASRVRGSRQAHAGVRALLDGGGRARLDRYRARRARLRREVLHRRRQLGPGRQQHPGLLHPGRDEVSRPRSRRETGAAPRHAAGRERARHVLGFRLADARVRAHADVGHVGSRDPAQLPHDAGLRRAHVPHGQRARATACS